MTEKHKMEADGIRADGVSFYPAGNGRLQMFSAAHEQLASFKTPVLAHASNPHEHIFVAALDGTGNDAIRDPEHQTNVALIAHQVEEQGGDAGARIAAGYVPGAGTQQSPIKRALDGMDGYTSEERAESMYKQFIERAYAWRKADPDARISVAEIGFSRGADEVAIFARLVQERGIQDPRGAKYTFTGDDLVKHVEYTRPPLVPPGQVAQAVALFDPVGTGNELRNDDRRLPPSVVSGIQLTSTDERRRLFKSDHIIDPGITADGRFAGVYVPGAHSDVGGSYHRNGLSNRAGNLVVDYLNGLSDQPYLKKSAEPDDPRLNVVHRSEQGMFIYRISGKVDRLEPEGYNERLVPRRDVGKVPDAYNAEPRDEALSRGLDWQRMPNGPVPGAPAPTRPGPEQALSMQLDRMLDAARGDDWQSFRQGTQAWAAMDAGRQLHQQAARTVDGLEQAAMRPPMPESPFPPAQEQRGPAR